MSNQLDVETLFESWQSMVQKEYGNRFLHSVREEIIDELVESLFRNNIPLDDALFLKSRVKAFMVTKEGSKGTGKYKGWTANVDKDFSAAIVEYYANNTQKPDGIIKDYGNYPYMLESPVITAWAKEEYGPCWTNELNLLVHMHGHRFNQEFQSKVMDSNWAKSGEDMPEWAEKLFKA